MKTYAILVTIAFGLMFTTNIIDDRTIKHQQEIIDTREYCVSWCEEQWNDYGC